MGLVVFRESERERHHRGRGERSGCNFLREREREGAMAAAATAAASAAAADKQPSNEHSFSPVHIYQEVVGYERPKKEKGRAGSQEMHWRGPINHGDKVRLLGSLNGSLLNRQRQSDNILFGL